MLEIDDGGEGGHHGVVEGKSRCLQKENKGIGKRTKEEEREEGHNWLLLLLKMGCFQWEKA